MTRTDILSFSGGGHAILDRPGNLSPESQRMLVRWLQLVRLRMKRARKAASKRPETGEGGR